MHCFIWLSIAVREFLCLDDPPGPFDSLEESRVSTILYFFKKAASSKIL